MVTREVGPCLTSCLVVSVAWCLSLDLQIVIAALQEFKSKEIRNNILRTFNIFTFVRDHKNQVLSKKRFGCFRTPLFLGKWCGVTIYFFYTKKIRKKYKFT